MVASGEKRKTGKCNTVWLINDKGLIYRICVSTNVEDGKEITQLVVPKKLRYHVMAVAHESTFGGNLGAKKTSEKILTQCYWPALQDDVLRCCRSCDICQRTFPKGKVIKAHLTEMPRIEEPFRRVAVDIVGPIFPNG